MDRKRLLLPVILGITIVIAILWGMGIFSSARAAPTGTTYYVDADNVSGHYTGTSWTTAFTTVKDAMVVADYGDQIWVAEGVYYPDEGGTGSDDDPNSYFLWDEGFKLYGGFDPGSGIDEFGERDWEVYPTVLSGDITQNDTTDINGVITDPAKIVGPNSYRLVYTLGLTETAVMDGFHITGGSSSYDGVGMVLNNTKPTLVNLRFSGNKSSEYGGGLRIRYFPMSGSINCHPTLTNVHFTNNVAEEGGGGVMWDSGCTPNLTNVTFIGNHTDNFGGGMHIIDSFSGNTVLTNVMFVGNTADWGGGGLYMERSNATIINGTFVGNEATFLGGGIYMADRDLILKNVILWGNTAPTGGDQIFNDSSDPTYSYCDIQGSGGSSGWDSSLGSDGGNNIDSDPHFIRNPSSGTGGWTNLSTNDYGDLHLQLTSPTIDSGTNSICPAYDLDGRTRPINTCDMGVYESGMRLSLPLVMR